MKFFPVSASEYVNLFQVVSLVDRGNKIELVLCDGTPRTIEADADVRKLRAVIENHK